MMREVVDIPFRPRYAPVRSFGCTVSLGSFPLCK
jgi:hypothetical protein